uniref:F-box associated domain-containing protein n=2 Tax=Aegilops tauschii TaxID=37682 RepID=A0A453GJM4_AEGTS
MYPHGPTGEYRILLAPDDPDDSYQVYTLGPSEPPRHIDIEGPNVEDLSPSTHLMFRGSLHWCIGSIIHVFNTTTESFWQMLAPDVPHSVDRYVMDILYGAVLFEMDGMLSMPILTDEFTSIGIWAMQDYENEVWTSKYRVELPLADLTVQFGKFNPCLHGVPAFWDGDVIILVQFGEWLLRLDMDGKLVANLCHCRGLFPTRHQLKQTLVQHTFFPTLEGYTVNASPFI